MEWFAIGFFVLGSLFGAAVVMIFCSLPDQFYHRVVRAPMQRARREGFKLGYASGLKLVDQVNRNSFLRGSRR